MSPPIAVRLVRGLGSEKCLSLGDAGEENRHKLPTLEQGRMFMPIRKGYIWMWVDIMERLETG
jgi:hypothetical protein